MTELTHSENRYLLKTFERRMSLTKSYTSHANTKCFMNLISQGKNSSFTIDVTRIKKIKIKIINVSNLIIKHERNKT